MAGTMETNREKSFGGGGVNVGGFRGRLPMYTERGNERVPFTERAEEQNCEDQRRNWKDKNIKTGAAIGGVARAAFGAGAGAGIGALVGSIIPGAGTALGALVGAGVGALIGATLPMHTEKGEEKVPITERVEEEYCEDQGRNRKDKDITRTVIGGAVFRAGVGTGTGALIGAGMGSAIPGPGTAIGAAMGAGIGGIVGAFTGLGAISGAGAATGVAVAGAKDHKSKKK